MGKPQVDQKIIMVTGKGGVGKSTIAGAVAFYLSRQGHKVLLTEFSEPSYFSRIFNGPISYQPRLWQPNLWVCAWDGENSLREFLLHYIKLERVVNLFLENRVMKTLVRAAPALKELALLGKLTSGIRGIGPAMEYDYIVVDAFASGHFKALVDVPRGMAEAVQFGPMGEQSQAINEVLVHPEHCQTLVVTLAEELPVTEAQELFRDLSERGAKNLRIICNRVLDFPVSSEKLDRLAEKASGETGPGDFLNALSVWQKRQEKSLSQLNSELNSFPERTVVTAPFLFATDPAERIKKMADAVGPLWIS